MSILPVPSFLDDVKEKGLKKAIFEGIDESVERLTAGMNVQDVREALRGEDPSRRPNPRLTPHADGFGFICVPLILIEMSPDFIRHFA